MIVPRAKSLAILGLGSSVGTPPEGNGDTFCSYLYLSSTFPSVITLISSGVEAEVLVVQSFEELKHRANETAGKIVVFNQPFVSYEETVAYRAFGASEAAKVGAVATLIRSVTPFSVNRCLTLSSTFKVHVGLAV